MHPASRLGIGLAVRGDYREMLVPSPAAGAEWSFTLPSGYWWLLALGRAVLTTSAAVATRASGLQIANGDGTRFYATNPGATVAATLAQEVSYSAGGPQGPAGAAAVATIDVPEVILPGGWRVGSLTQALDVADQYSGVRLYLLQLYDDSPDEAPGQLRRHHHPDLEVDIHAA